MKSAYDKIWGSALNIIKARMVSRSDLRKKLLFKYPEEEGYIIQTLDEMERVMLIDDKRYTEQLINHLIQKNVGRLKIKMEVRKRGLSEDAAETALMNSEYDEEKWCKRAMEGKTVSDTDPRKRKQKLMNFLRGRGFTDAVIYQVFRKQGSELS